VKQNIELRFLQKKFSKSKLSNFSEAKKLKTTKKQKKYQETQQQNC